MLVLQIISLLITAGGALLGTLGDFRKDGRVTRLGVVAVVLVVAGFIASATILVLKDQQQRRAESRADDQRRRANRLQETLLRTQLKEKSARQLTLSVSFRRPPSSGSAIVSFVDTRNGTYAFVIPVGYPGAAKPFEAKAGIVKGRLSRLRGGLVNGQFKWQRGTIDNGRFRRLSDSDVRYVELGSASGVKTKSISIAIARHDLRPEEWLIDVAADIEGVEHYSAAADGGGGVDPRDLHRAVDSVAAVRLLVDDLPVQVVRKSRFADGLIIARPQGTLFAKGDYVQGQFFQGTPPWGRLVSAAASGKNPASVSPSNQQKGEGDQILRPD